MESCYFAKQSMSLRMPLSKVLSFKMLVTSVSSGKNKIKIHHLQKITPKKELHVIIILEKTRETNKHSKNSPILRSNFLSLAAFPPFFTLKILLDSKLSQLVNACPMSYGFMFRFLQTLV